MGEGIFEQLTGINSKKKTGPIKKSDEEVNSQIAMGLRLRERRLKLKLSLGEVAKASGVSAARYNNWEERFGPLPQSRYLNILAKVLGTHPSWIRTGEVDSSEEDKQATSTTSLVLWPPVSTC
jgi:DNA-binding transcriptional regulator YiaG